MTGSSSSPTSTASKGPASSMPRNVQGSRSSQSAGKPSSSGVAITTRGWSAACSIKCRPRQTGSNRRLGSARWASIVASSAREFAARSIWLPAKKFTLGESESPAMAASGAART